MKSYEVEDAGREAAERLREEPDYWDEMAAMFETPPPLPLSAHEDDLLDYEEGLKYPEEVRDVIRPATGTVGAVRLG